MQQMCHTQAQLEEGNKKNLFHLNFNLCRIPCKCMKTDFPAHCDCQNTQPGWWNQDAVYRTGRSRVRTKAENDSHLTNKRTTLHRSLTKHWYLLPPHQNNHLCHFMLFCPWVQYGHRASLRLFRESDDYKENRHWVISTMTKKVKAL